MPRNVELLLTETVETLGIVGDVVKVRTGYARNYLLPLGMATEPSEEKIKALAVKRADAERHLAELRTEREGLIRKIEGVEITIQRSCNDQGHLYGSVSQQDIADAMVAAGFGVKARDVRLSQVIKRIDSYHVPIKLDTDLEAEIKLWVVADRQINLDEREEMDFDNEGNLIEKGKGAKRERREREGEDDAPHAGEKKGHKKGEAPSAPPPEEKKGFFTKRAEPRAEAEPEAKADKKDEKKDERKGKKKRE